MENTLKKKLRENRQAFVKKKVLDNQLEENIYDSIPPTFPDEEYYNAYDNIPEYDSCDNFSLDVVINDEANNKPKKSYRKIDYNFWVKQKYLNIDTNEISLEFKIKLDKNKYITRIFSRSDVYTCSDAFINSGINTFEKRLVQSKVQTAEKNLPLQLLHSSLGFDKRDDSIVYKGYDAINMNSRYVGSFDIQPKGSYENWLAGIKKYVMPTFPLQFMLILGLSSVTMGYLRDKVDGSLFVHVYSDSSKGKTTGCALALSTAGNPLPSKEGNSLQIDWGDTSNFKVSALSNNYGYPIVIDEASKIGHYDISSFIYSCCNGISKGRLSSNGNQQSVHHWATCCISNGEHSLLPLCNKNQGIRARLIEISFPTITDSAEQADKLKEVIYSNYGFANKIFAEYLMKHSDKLMPKFEKLCNYLQESISIDSDIIPRLVRRFAIIIITADLASKAFDLDFDKTGITDKLISSLDEQNEEDALSFGDKLIEYLKEDYATNNDKYYDLELAEDNNFIPRHCMAVYKTIRGKTEILYFKSTFNDLLFKGGFNNTRLCLQELDKRGYLYHDKDRKTCKRKIFRNEYTVYCLKNFIDL